jgi:ABC-2 type transport system permease protein
VVRSTDVVAALYRTVLAGIATRARMVALGALGAATVLVGLSIRLAGPADLDRAGARFVDGVGLSVLAPVVALVFASAAFGDLVEDQTLVYLWLRPVPRSLFALAAYAAALSAALPLTVLPLTVAVALTGAGASVVAGTAVAVTVGVAGYVGLFTALGLRVQRALAWGLGYILIWEGFVASAGRGAGRLALRAYTRSVLSDASGTRLRLATMGPVAGVVVPLVVAAVALVYVSFRLRRHDVP